MKLHFKVDSRETNKDLFNAFDIYGMKKDFTWEKILLEVGDVVCGDICIERKTADDFVSSIMDGRLKEQSAKMFLNYKKRYFIIEGNPFRTERNIHQNCITGALSSLCAKYDCKVLFVEDPTHFVYMCYSLINKHMNLDEFNPLNHKTLSYKITDRDIITAMIHQIPGIGMDKAEKISGMFDSLQEFVNNSTKEKLMKIEGIGHKTAERIINLIKKPKNGVSKADTKPRTPF